MGRILAIDIGQKRIGLAVTDPMRIIATPLDTVHVKDIWEYLKTYTNTHEVDLFVAGLPKQNDGSPSSSMRYVKPFVQRLRKEFPNQGVEMYDERFTSVIAKSAILASGVGKHVRQDKSLVDKISATLLLQSWMESININPQKKH